VWVLNMVSDNISIVDVVARRVVDVIDVGDEPVDIVFSPDGAHAFVTLQGRADPASFDSANPQEGFVVVIDATTRQVVSSTFLDLHTPRSLAFDDVRSELLVAALHSGNNTTVVGRAAVLELNAPMPPDPTACEQNCTQRPLDGVWADP
jgi:YVTN family beta-propeller protein